MKDEILENKREAAMRLTGQVMRRSYPGMLPQTKAGRLQKAWDWWALHPDWTALEVCRRYKLRTRCLADWAKKNGKRIEEFFNHGKQ